MKIKSVLILLILLQFSSKGQVLVPNNESFGLLDVVTAIKWHSPSISSDLSSCFSNAVSNFFDPTYNQDSYAPANSMKRFRNYGAKNVLGLNVTTTWTAPAGVTKIYVNVQGGGGSGGGGTVLDFQGGGGGGGGSHGCVLSSVIAGNSYLMTVGTIAYEVSQADGNDGNYSQANLGYSQYIRAGGGTGGRSYLNGGAGGSGGGVSHSFGVTPILSYSGGNGANAGEFSGGGGGGGSAGSTGNGKNASNSTGGLSTYANGGAGGNGATVANGVGEFGYLNGGGGGGSTKTSTSGRGMVGSIIIYF